jgi:hypothetical protein
MFFKNFLQILFIIRVFTPCIGLTRKAIENIETIPEYSEWLRREGYLKIKPIESLGYSLKKKSGEETTFVNDSNTSKNFSPHPPLHPFGGNFPSIQLCKESPDDIYGHIFCSAMICLYALLIITLIIYQFRSLFWLKLNIFNKNVQQRNSSNFESKQKDEQNIFRMLPV